MFRLAVFLFFPILLLPEPGVAQSVYKWTDERGAVHYSTSPTSAGAEPADLPAIERENIDRRIERLKAATPTTCTQHGGVDCNHGPDQDGSVVCVDGFGDSDLSFALHCSEAHLRVAEFALRTNDRSVGNSQMVMLSRDPRESQRRLYEHFSSTAIAGEGQSLRLVVRNISGVEARDVKARILLPGRKLVEAHGPENIELYSIGEFSVSLGPDGPLGDRGHRLRTEDIARITYEVKCANCAAPTGTRQMPTR